MRIWTIAVYTFREAARGRVALVTFLFSVLVVLSTQILSPLALGEGGKVTKDFGLSAISLFGAGIVIALGGSFVHKEMERKTIYVLASKPVRRTEFILGKFLGLLFTLLLVGGAMTATLTLLVVFREGAVDFLVLRAAGMTLLEQVLLASVAVFFASFTSAGLCSLFTAAAWVAGHFSNDLLAFADRFPGAGAVLARTMHYFLPDLALLNIRATAVHGVDVDPARYLFALAYTALYGIAMLSAASVVFERREFR
jgi:ABC-type transport system involved in multi-copper enzyme maturation permease subunit